MRLTTALFWGATLLQMLEVPSFGAPLFHLEEIPPFPGGSEFVSRPSDINNNGIVVGHAAHQAFAWSSGQDLQSLGGFDHLFTASELSKNTMTSSAYAITNFNIVFGGVSYKPQAGVGRGLPVNWQTADLASLVDTPFLPPFVPTSPGYSAVVLGANNSGASVGMQTNVSQHAFLNVPGYGVFGLKELDVGSNPFSYSIAHAINSEGEIVGVSNGHAVIWYNPITVEELPALTPSAASVAYAINDLGDVVGASGASTGFQRPFLWNLHLGIIDITIGSDFIVHKGQANDVNERREIVGFADDFAFYWDETDGLHDLNSLLDASGTGWHLTNAFAINDFGQIVGLGVSPLGTIEGVLLSPVLSTPIPEPASLVLLLLGTCIFTWHYYFWRANKYGRSGYV